MELKLIYKYKVKHSLTNTYDEGKFQSQGQKSARVYFTKPVYLYDNDGNFVKEFNSTKDLCKELNLKEITVKKILSRKKRYGKNIKYNI